MIKGPEYKTYEYYEYMLEEVGMFKFGEKENKGKHDNSFQIFEG